MNAIKKFQSVAGTGNPVYISDVTYPTELINILGGILNNFGRSAYILGGFDPDPAIEGNFTPGAVWFNGQVYAWEGETVPGGQYLYAASRQADSRITIDGQEYNAYMEYYLFASISNTETTGTLVAPSVISDYTISILKAPLIPDGAITAAKMATGVIPATLPPNGNAGGDLTGTYPNPSVGTDKLTFRNMKPGQKPFLIEARLTFNGSNNNHDDVWSEQIEDMHPKVKSAEPFISRPKKNVGLLTWPSNPL